MKYLFEENIYVSSNVPETFDPDSLVKDPEKSNTLNINELIKKNQNQNNDEIINNISIPIINIFVNEEIELVGFLLKYSFSLNKLFIKMQSSTTEISEFIKFATEQTKKIFVSEIKMTIKNNQEKIINLKSKEFLFKNIVLDEIHNSLSTVKIVFEKKT